MTMSDQITKSDRLALMMAREGKERSRALPQASYRDPARYVKFKSEQGDDEMLKRVRKEDVKIDTWVKPDALAYCLECWKAWMSQNDTDLGIQGQKSLKGEGDGFGNDDTMGSRRDNDIAQATDAMIDSLRQLHQWAIKKKMGITSVWNFPSADFITTVDSAECELTKKLKINIATRSLF